MKIGIRLAITSLGLVLLSALQEAGSVIRVPGDRPTIQAAIYFASHGDTVLVAPGFYNEQLDYLGKAITVISSGGPTATTIDASGLNGWWDAPDFPVVRFINGEGRGSILNGFAITGHDHPYGSGLTSPIYCPGLSPTIINCIVENNTGGSGGGIYGNAYIMDCVIANNVGGHGRDGGGIAGAPTVIRCTIINNTAIEGHGGGVAVAGECDIIDSVIIGNRAGGDGRRGGGVYGPARLDGCIIANNIATTYYQISSVGAGIDGAALVRNCSVFSNSVVDPYFGDEAGITNTAKVIDSIVWDNYPREFGGGIVGTVTFSCVKGGFAGNGNIADDPRIEDGAADDYRLRADSPCIDNGDPSSPPDPDGTRIDMGGMFYAQFEAETNYRFGGFVNPFCYSNVSLPELGTTWTASVSTAFYGGQPSLTAIAYFSNGTSYVIIPAGELLVDPTSTFLGITVAVPIAGIGQHSLPIPNEHDLCGVWVYSQAAVLGGGPELCNAVDVLLGY